MRRRRLAPARPGSIGLATLLVAASVIGLSGPAAAAACPRGTGVTVVVKGSVTCDADGGGSAASNFRDADVSLKAVQGQPGLVCQVNGAPAGDPCINAYSGASSWQLWWSDGNSGTWYFAQQGVAGLTIPAGGWVGFGWEGQPSASPVPPAPVPPKSAPGGSGGGAASPGPGPGGGPGAATTAPGSSVTAAPEASASPSAIPGATADSSTDPSASTGSERDDDPAATSSTTEARSGNVGRMLLAVVVIVSVAGAAVLVNRRRQRDA